MASCPHPCCSGKQYDSVVALRRHFFDVHSIEEPRSNCVKRKRRWASGLGDPDNDQDAEQGCLRGKLAEEAEDKEDIYEDALPTPMVELQQKMAQELNII
jgi:hypothetical protein